MNTWGKTFVIFLLFFMGTTALLHVDRQCAIQYGKTALLADSVTGSVAYGTEKMIEKYASFD